MLFPGKAQQVLIVSTQRIQNRLQPAASRQGNAKTTLFGKLGRRPSHSQNRKTFKRFELAPSMTEGIGTADQQGIESLDLWQSPATGRNL